MDIIRETMMGEGLTVCPLTLLFKDHKGWNSDMGTIPPTRPVVGGNIGMNLHLSEIVSDVLDPVIENYEGGCEIISTEDLIANLDWTSRMKKMKVGTRTPIGMGNVKMVT